MDPLTAALLVGASLATSLYSNKQQAKIEQSSIKLQTEQARLQAAEGIYERSKTFRQNISSNLALSSLGVGGTSGFRNVFQEGLGNYASDVSAIQMGAKFAALTGETNTALSKANKLGNDASSIANATMLASNLGLFKSPTTTKPVKLKK